MWECALRKDDAATVAADIGAWLETTMPIYENPQPDYGTEDRPSDPASAHGEESTGDTP